MTGDLERRVRTFLVEELLLDPEDLDDVLIIGARALSETVADLGAAIEARDPELCQHHAHGLKGNLRNMGLSDLAELARDIETRAASGDAAGCRDRLDRLAELSRPFIQAFADQADPDGDAA